MAKETELTTIAIYRQSKKRLDELKEYPDQSYAKIVQKLLKRLVNIG